MLLRVDGKHDVSLDFPRKYAYIYFWSLCTCVRVYVCVCVLPLYLPELATQV